MRSFLMIRVSSGAAEHVATVFRRKMSDTLEIPMGASTLLLNDVGMNVLVVSDVWVALARCTPLSLARAGWPTRSFVDAMASDKAMSTSRAYPLRHLLEPVCETHRA